MAVASSGANVQALSRSLDKVFDEAQLTGVLLLSGRNLKEFPNVASRFDLTDTVEVDLSKNRFTEFPVQISEYLSLETLFLYHNCIRSIPLAVQFLESLTHLDLSRNQLQCIPAVLCTLPLEVLLLGNNRLSSLPKEICQLSDTLTELDVSCNKLMELPAEIGDLKKLRVLNARENLLSELPYELCKLKLQILYVSSNRISNLHLDLRHMTTLVRLDLNHNPLVFPPAKLCNSGRVHVFKALEVAFVKQTKRQHGVANYNKDQDLHKRYNTLKPNSCRLIPTDPDDYKYVLNEKVDKRKNRHHTIAADSGYSTLTDDTSKSLRDMNASFLRKRSPPVGEEAPPPFSSTRRRYGCETTLSPPSGGIMSFSMYSNGSTQIDHVTSSRTPRNCTNDSSTSSFVEEVMSACMQRIQQNSTSLMTSSSADAVGPPVADNDEITRELWRQREEYMIRKKRAGLLRMEVLQDAGESMLSPSVTSGVDLNYNNYTGRNYDNASAMDSTLLKSPSNSSAASRFVDSGTSAAPSSGGIYAKEKPSAFSSPPRAVKSELIQSIYNGTAAAPGGGGSSVKRFAAPPPPPPPPCVSCESRVAVESLLTSSTNSKRESSAYCSATLRDDQLDSVEKTVTVVTPTSSDFAPPVIERLNDVAVEPKTKKRVNLVDNVDRKKPTKDTPSSNGNQAPNGRGSLSSSQSSVSSTSTSSSCRSRQQQQHAVSSSRSVPASLANGVESTTGATSSGGGRPTVNGRASRPPPPPPPNRSSTTSASSTVNRRISVPSNQREIADPGGGALELENGGKNGTLKHVSVNSNVAVATATTVRRPSDSVDRQQVLIDEMRKALEEKLNVNLPMNNAQLSEALSDGVYLCNYLNFLRPKTVRSVHLPNDSVPKLTLAKRNVENFLTGCRRLAIPENNLFVIGDVAEKRNLWSICRTLNHVTKQLSAKSKPTTVAPPSGGGDQQQQNNHNRATQQRMTKV